MPETEEVETSPLGRTDSGGLAPVAAEKSPASAPVHTVTVQQTARNAGLIFGMKKSVFAMVALCGVGITGTGGYFFSQYLRNVPDKEGQIDALSSEVDRLEAQVDVLKSEVDRLAATVVELGAEVTRLTIAIEDAQRIVDELTLENEQLAQQNEILIASNVVLAEQNAALNASNAILQENVNDLSEINEERATLIGEQNQTIQALEEQVVDLTNAAVALNATAQALEIQVAKLENETIALEAINDELEADVVELNATALNLTVANQNLIDLNNELVELLQFFNDSLVDESFSGAIITINDLIDQNNFLLVTQTKQGYVQSASNWDCSFFDSFVGAPFLDDLNSPIGSSYSEAMSILDADVFSELCLDVTNIEEYLQEEFSLVEPELISYNQLYSGVTTYTDLALAYYFPIPNFTNGLTPDDWLAASSLCSNLPPDLLFRI